MHIGFLSPEYVNSIHLDGGLATYIRKVGFAIAQRGHQVSVLVLSQKNAFWQDGPIIVYEIKQVTLPYWLQGIPLVRSFLLATAQFLSARRLERVVWQIHRHQPFDLLQTSSYMAPGYTLRHNPHIPVVCRVSSYTPIWRSAYGMQRKFGDYLSDWLEIRQVLDATASFAPSYLLAEIYARVEGFRPQVIRTPIDLSSISMDESYYQKHLLGKSYLLFFGALSRIKGVDLLADVIPQILSAKPDLLFVFVGRDNKLPSGQKVFDYLCDRCSEWQQQLQYHSPLPKSQLYPIISHSLGVLMPSRIDNYPNACIEAQYLGIPVVGTFNSSLDEIIQEGETGFLCQNEDPLSLKQAIERLLYQTDLEKQQMKTKIEAKINMIVGEDRITNLLSFYQAIIDNFRATKSPKT